MTDGTSPEGCLLSEWLLQSTCNKKWYRLYKFSLYMLW